MSKARKLNSLSKDKIAAIEKAFNRTFKRAEGDLPPRFEKEDGHFISAHTFTKLFRYLEIEQDAHIKYLKSELDKAHDKLRLEKQSEASNETV